jgi:2-polyprenyl-3-methyl-5-hydroxy-6-metoxy-1,4-benzoquinol methylase
MDDKGDLIVRSWTDNADSWTAVVRDGLIPSRQAGTNAAIVDACLALGAGPVLDIGCGEGWLVRTMSDTGISAAGVDVSPRLIERARELGSGSYTEASYATLERDAALLAGPWRGIVCNFSLLGDPLHLLLASLRARLAPEGRLLIQTLHPWAARGNAPYRSEWRTESFDTCSVAFPSPMPWYYRTLGSWQEQISLAGLRIVKLVEPVHPDSGAPLSLLLTCEAT